jgi:ATP-dependent helicase/nuclease subunit A
MIGKEAPTMTITRNKPPGSTWTDEQWQAIVRRGGNLLVAAAAGSGKTAVLVERIIRRITEGPAPIDVDRLLVATFTKAAADEMRERIRTALEKRLEDHPHDEHLRRQLAYIHRALITTLHSFCHEVVRRHFRELGLAPDFRIGNEAETALIRRDALEAMFEAEYAERDPDSDFWRLVECFGGERSDEPLYRLVDGLYEFSRSHPWPDEWLDEQAGRFAGDGGAWFESLRRDVRIELASVLHTLEEALRLTQRPGGPAPYAETLAAEAQAVGRAVAAAAQGGWAALHECVHAVSFDKLKSVRGDACDKRLKEQAKALRDQAKQRFARLKEELFGRSPEAYLADLRAAAPLMRELVRLVRRFASVYEQAKRERGVLDFADLEHYCLRVLRAPESTPDRVVPSAAALAYREQFEEVLLDEYQDTNQVQEAIVALISRDSPAGNRFMVGDVKQSIYRFRLADPGLFLHKYRTYVREQAMETGVEEGRQGTAPLGAADIRPADLQAGAPAGRPAAVPAGSPESRAEDRPMSPAEGLPEGIRIDLARNFRSRKEILDAVNRLFRRLMTESVGEMDYDDAARLIPGASFPEPPGRRPEDGFVDVLILDRGAAAPDTTAAEGDAAAQDAVAPSAGDAEPGEDAPEEDATVAQLEARMIAQQIKRLMGGEHGMPFMVADKATRGFRPVRYRDIVVLLRATQDWAPVMLEELRLAGIPAYAELSTGYFSAVEVEVMLALLSIIDNPYQDIPLAAVLRSPIAGLTEEEMAAVRAANRAAPYFYDAVVACARAEETSEALRGKLERFLRRLELWRREARQTPVSDLLWRIYRMTGYYETAGAMPGGAQRQANLRALYDRARQYESTSFRGLFRFLRFIERLREQGGDLGAAGTLGEQEDVVRIMSIHKSKGLEFPVVFVAGLGKRFNLQDLNGPFLMHKELGFGPKLVDEALEIRYPTLANLAIRRRILLETLAEEMRILYVALTRPKEKLILIGTVRDATKAAAKWAVAASGPGPALPDGVLAEARCYLDWIGPALIRHPDAAVLRELAEMPPAAAEGADGEPSRWNIAVGGAEGLAQAAAARAARDETIMQAVYRLEPVYHLGSDMADEIERRLAWEYPYSRASAMLSKTSVSEMKRRIAGEEERRGEWEEDAAGLDQVVADRAKRPSFGKRLLRRPRFLEARRLTAAERGTLYHTVMQHLPFDLPADPAAVRAWIERQAAARRLPTYAAEEVDEDSIAAFLRSELAARIRASADVRRELPFTFGVPAERVYPDADPTVAGETILMQGVMDCLFSEPEGWVLVDYKTDALGPDRDFNRIRERYALQLDLYCEAVGRILKQPVKEAYLYLFDGAATLRMR